MHSLGTRLELSASDLSQFLGCRHRTALELAVANGLREEPSWMDPLLVALQARGLDHERRYADSLRVQELTIQDLSDSFGADAIANSTEAMRSGVDVLLQPALRDGRWFGRPDVLRRVETKSPLGDWSYEVYDTKLAKETRGSTVLQLALYSEMLSRTQGVLPDRFHVVTPDPKATVQSFRVNDFSAYFRLVRRRLDETLLQTPDAIAAAHYPEPVEQCEICRWWSDCNKRRRDDDHLSFVAGVSRLQITELRFAGVATLAQLGSLADPLPFAPRRGATETYVRIREQARVQLAGRTQQFPVHELLPIEPDAGLARLPAPSDGDVFLDLEGDPFARDGGREYLFGWIVVRGGEQPKTMSLWAHTDAEERSVFESVVDEIMRLWSSNPTMHVYHYAPYEPSAFKRLMGRHATREAEVDFMLRAELFVDLHSVVKHAVRASVEQYSIKALEPFYVFKRALDLSDARTNLRIVERALELGDVDAITADVRSAVESYNLDDCRSALQLRAWLEGRRTWLIANGTPVPRPQPKEGAASAAIGARAARVQAAVAALTAGISADRAQRNEEQQAKWLLAHLLDWHRREDKAPWWEFFRLCELPEDELLDEKLAIAGLRFLKRVGGTAKCPIDSYSYPPQDTEIRKGGSLRLPQGKPFGDVDTIDREARIINVKKRALQAEVHPTAVFAHSVVPSDVLANVLLAFADHVIEHGLDDQADYRLARQLLLARPPRVSGAAFDPPLDGSEVAYAQQIAARLDNTVLAIQGPPGAGKTHTGAKMICELVQSGARVGVAAVSHKVIGKLLLDTMKLANQAGVQMTCVHKVSEKSAVPTPIEEVTGNEEAIASLRSGHANVLGGTAWLWARPDAKDLCDVLFVDEAGQMSLANALAVTQAAKNIVLLGDPRQLEQPQQGSHPDGADVSSMDHILGVHLTIPPDRGLFLQQTWRLAPDICEFTSEVFYEGRLHARDGLERQQLLGVTPFDGAGLWVVPVDHEGNQNSALEEAVVVDQIVCKLLHKDAQWIDRFGALYPITSKDILVVAPYNAHVGLLEERLSPKGIRVGTVDRFQGQEAPVVIYSMATSSPENAPRGMEFLYSLNRLNVATSRAQCACILVASPRLFEPECKSSQQMRLANALCRYVELARAVSLN